MDRLDEGVRSSWNYYHLDDAALAPAHLHAWLSWASRSRLTPFVRLGLDNGRLEGLNSRIRLISRSRLAPFVKLAHTIRRHRAGILHPQLDRSAAIWSDSLGTTSARRALHNTPVDPMFALLLRNDKLAALMPKPSSRRGTLVISLDFELNWGVRDWIDLDSYRANLLGVRTALPRLLEMFAEYGIHATWATVGFLFFDEKEDLLAGLPRLRPRYADTSKCPYTALAMVGKDEAQDPFHFGWSLLQQIQQAGGQEIASHTFSHYFCFERGQDAATFREDLAAAVNAGARRGIALESLVFPRNEVRADYLPLCAQQGIKAYRGTPRSWLYRPRAARDETVIRRALRLLDAYVPLTGQNTHCPDAVAAALPRNVPASRFLRPYDARMGRLDQLKVNRVCNELSAAASAGGLYHLWWHPHNFGIHQDENFDMLRHILRHFAELREAHGMQSLTMRDAALATAP